MKKYGLEEEERNETEGHRRLADLVFDTQRSSKRRGRENEIESTANDMTPNWLQHENKHTFDVWPLSRPINVNILFTINFRKKVAKLFFPRLRLFFAGFFSSCTQQSAAVCNCRCFFRSSVCRWSFVLCFCDCKNSSRWEKTDIARGFYTFSLHMDFFCASSCFFGSLLVGWYDVLLHCLIKSFVCRVSLSLGRRRCRTCDGVVCAQRSIIAFFVYFPYTRFNRTNFAFLWSHLSHFNLNNYSIYCEFNIGLSIIFCRFWPGIPVRTAIGSPHAGDVW